MYTLHGKKISKHVFVENVKHVFEKYCTCMKTIFQSFKCVKKLDFKASIWKKKCE